MQSSTNKLQGETPSSGGAALLTGAALLGGAALLAATPKSAQAASLTLTFSALPGSGDFKVLNFALALEAIEADLYAQALMRLTTGGTNALGQTITGLGVASSDPFAQYLTEFGAVENRHRDFLIGVLGTSAITTSTLKGAKFDFGINSLSAEQLLDFLIAVEDTGVQAYLSALPYLVIGSPYLTTAAAIQGTEARHTAALIVVRNALYGSTESPAPLYNENTGRDGIIREGKQKGASIQSGISFLDTVLAGVSPFIVV